MTELDSLEETAAMDGWRWDENDLLIPEQEVAA